MDWKQFVSERVPRLALPAAREAEILAELAQLLEDTYEEARGEGCAQEEALIRAAAQLPEGGALAQWIEQAERPVVTRVPSPLRVEQIEDRMVRSRRGMDMHEYF